MCLWWCSKVLLFVHNVWTCNCQRLIPPNLLDISNHQPIQKKESWCLFSVPLQRQVSGPVNIMIYKYWYWFWPVLERIVILEQIWIPNSIRFAIWNEYEYRILFVNTETIRIYSNSVKYLNMNTNSVNNCNIIWL